MKNWGGGADVCVSIEIRGGEGLAREITWSSLVMATAGKTRNSVGLELFFIAMSSANF